MRQIENHLTSNLIRYSVFLVVLLVVSAHVAETAFAMGQASHCTVHTYP